VCVACDWLGVRGRREGLTALVFLLGGVDVQFVGRGAGAGRLAGVLLGVTVRACICLQPVFVCARACQGVTCGQVCCTDACNIQLQVC
jgi:hypothetical protein